MRIFRIGLLNVGVDIIHRLLNSGNFFRFLVRNLAIELFFESHNQFDGVQRVGTEIINEGRFPGHLFLLDAKLLDDDLLDALFNGTHTDFPSPGGGALLVPRLV
jgi:hypothetical protein